MNVVTVSRACFVAALALGLLAALTAGTPQKLSENSVAVGGACNDCSGVNWDDCRGVSSEEDCTDTQTVRTCYSDPPDSGTCSKFAEIHCDPTCRVTPNSERCN